MQWERTLPWTSGEVSSGVVRAYEAKVILLQGNGLTPVISLICKMKEIKVGDF